MEIVKNWAYPRQVTFKCPPPPPRLTLPILNSEIKHKIQNQRKCYLLFIVWMSLTKLCTLFETAFRQLFTCHLIWICALSLIAKMTLNSAVIHKLPAIWVIMSSKILYKEELRRKQNKSCSELHNIVVNAITFATVFCVLFLIRWWR